MEYTTPYESVCNYKNEVQRSTQAVNLILTLKVSTKLQIDADLLSQFVISRRCPGARILIVVNILCVQI